MNEYGLDARYFKEKLNQIVRDADRYTPSEMERALMVYVEVARSQKGFKDPEVIRKAVFWRCPNECNDFVDWNDDKTQATCRKCETKSKFFGKESR